MVISKRTMKIEKIYSSIAKKKIMNTLIHKAKPYPKDAYQFYPEIQKIEVKSEEKDKFY